MCHPVSLLYIYAIYVCGSAVDHVTLNLWHRDATRAPPESRLELNEFLMRWDQKWSDKHEEDLLWRGKSPRFYCANEIRE